jgi:hypothetical protein
MHINNLLYFAYLTDRSIAHMDALMSKLPQMTFEIVRSDILIFDIVKTLECLPLTFVMF